MTAPTKSHCSGCDDNFYNGNNPYGVQECWCFKTAKLIPRVRIPIDLRPPYLHIKPQQMMDCRHEKGYVLVKPEVIASDGYWKS